MNYELDVYLDAMKDLPSKEIPLETLDATFYHFKTDVFKRQMSYSSDPNYAANLVTLSVERVKEIMAMNKAGKKPEKLEEKTETIRKPEVDFQNVVGQDSLTRFDKKKNQHQQHQPNREKQNNQNQQNSEQQPVENQQNNQENRNNNQRFNNRKKKRRRPHNNENNRNENNA